MDQSKESNLSLRWVGDAELDRVAQTRTWCYAHSPAELADLRERIDCQGRAREGDYLLAEKNGQAVGTATTLDMVMWVRGKPVKCQGVAWVGAIKTERRKGSGGKSPGVASAVMWEVLRKARDEGVVLSSLCPWRASFYEHFGYGLMERRCDWTVPLSVMPTGDFDGVRFLDVERDREALAACEQRVVEQGQCDLERSGPRWEHYFRVAPKTDFTIVDRPTENGPIVGWMSLQYQAVNGKDTLRSWYRGHDGTEALLRQLRFLGSLRDQYSTVTITTPAALQVNRLLKEVQIPHRGVTHAAADAKLYSRLQTRVMDHVKLIEGMKVSERATGSAVVAVRETEGHVSKFRVELAGGRATAGVSDGSADVEISDRDWAAVVLGDLRATEAARLGLLAAQRPEALDVLDAFSDGPAPFCRDYF